MKLLFLAPQPFFQERGTPIAVRLALEVIAERFQNQTGKKFDIDLLCYHEGADLNIQGVNIHRINPGILRSYLKNVTPGISVKKLICDILFALKALSLVIKNRKEQYHLIHAVEESVFIALIFKFIFRIPYIYDMDSSLAMQVTEKWILFKPLYPLLSIFEKIAVKCSLAVAPVCDSLGIIAEKYGAKSMVVLRDVSLLNDNTENVNLRSELNLPEDAKIILYVGNLESYQGIDLLLESFEKICKKATDWNLVVIGGSSKDQETYRNITENEKFMGRALIAGPRPVALLGNYIKQADILVSPRIKGNNTPMKIYSYLHSGKAMVATNLPTHTQVLDNSVCILTQPDSGSFSSGLLTLIEDQSLRAKLASAAYQLAEKNYTFRVFSIELNKLYDLIRL